MLMLFFLLLTISTTITAGQSLRNGRSNRFHCGCWSCTDEIWNALATDAVSGNSHSCGARIEWIQQHQHVSEQEACRVVAGQEFNLGPCGPYCDPDKCQRMNSNTHLSNGAVVIIPPETTTSTSETTPETTTPPASFHCGCPKCTDSVWNRMTSVYTCGERITWLVKHDKDTPTEEAACIKVAHTQFPDICGTECDPTVCHATSSDTEVVKQPPPSPPSVPSPPSDNDSNSFHCGCRECTDDIYNTIALDYNDAESNYTCGQRIEWLANKIGSMERACKQVSQVEFPGVCGPACHPERCDGRSWPLQTTQPTIAPASNKPLLQPSTHLYCFPPHSQRTRYEGVWGAYTMQVKESNTQGAPKFCGPHNNYFATENVEYNSNSLKLMYQYLPSKQAWAASEVRLVPSAPSKFFGYGTYSFRIQSIQIRNINTNGIISNTLPPSLILGLFTWDDTEDYAKHENYNHEVDFELSRWGDARNVFDGQFLVQPPQRPQLYRFRTGNTEGMANTYQWTWNPGHITWAATSKDSSTGETVVIANHSYTTAENMRMGVPDYVQCLNKGYRNMEIRMNLWNMHGSTVSPMEMSKNERVEVTVDEFQYIPSSKEYMERGSFCTKHCQCQDKCIEGVCV